MRSRWLKSMGKKDWTPADKAVICERHFEPSCITKKVGDDGPFDKNGRRWKSRIALGSLPTILVPPGTPTEPVQVRVRKKRRGRNKKLMETRRKRGRRRLEEKDLGMYTKVVGVELGLKFLEGFLRVANCSRFRKLIKL